MDVDQPLNPGPIVSLNEKSIFVVSPYSHADIYKQIENLVLQTSDLQEKNPYSGNHDEERPVKKRKLTDEIAEENNKNNNAKRRKTNLPEAIFQVIEEQEDFVPFFLRPKSYIRFKENPFAEIIDEDDARVEYELDSDDETFLGNYNRKMENDQKEALKLNNEAFEHIVDVCEKEAFKLTMDKLKENEIEAAHKVCTVCKDGSSDDNNQIIFCDGCDMAVHQACYGVRSIPEGTWFCELCDVGIGPDNACKFCGQTGGAQKKTATTHRNEFVHVQCALWLPECHFKEDDCFGPVYYRKEIDKDRYRLQCNICNKRVGAPIQCSDKKCFASFHITCAQDKCYVMEMEESDQGVDFHAWCPKHTPPELKEKREKMIKDAEKRELSRKRAEVMKKQEEQVMLLNPKHFEHEKYCGGLELEKVKKNVKSVQPQTCSHIFRYWAEKRKRRRGLPLIKRFQPSVLKLAPPPPRLEDMSQENMIQGSKLMTSLRERLEKLRLMLDLVVKREKVKQRIMQIQTERFEHTMLPENIRWRAIVSSLEAEDTSALFLEPVSTHLVPDYYDVIKTPISFYDIRNKINVCNYKSDEEFWADVSLIFKNAKEYNKEDTFVYEEAVRIEAVVARVKKELASEQVPIISKRARELIEPVKKPVSTKKVPAVNNTNTPNMDNAKTAQGSAPMAVDDQPNLAPQTDVMNSSLAGDALTGVNMSFSMLNAVNFLNMSNTDLVNDGTAVNLSLNNYQKYPNNNADDLNGSDWAKIDPDSSLNIEDFLNTSVTGQNSTANATPANNSNNNKKDTDVEMRDVEEPKNSNRSDAVNQSVEPTTGVPLTPPGSTTKKSGAGKKPATKSSPTSKSSKTPKKSGGQSDNAKNEEESKPVETVAETKPEPKEEKNSSKKNNPAAPSSPKSDVKTAKRINKKVPAETFVNTAQESAKKDEMEISEEKDAKKEPAKTDEKPATTKNSSKKNSTAESAKKSTAAPVANGHVSTPNEKKKNSSSAKESPTKTDRSGAKAKSGEEKKNEPASDTPKSTANNKTPAKSEQKKEPASDGTKSTKKSPKSQSDKMTASESANESAAEKKEIEETAKMNGVHEEPVTPKKNSPKKAVEPKSTKKSDPKATPKKTDAKAEPEPKTPQRKSSATSKNSNKTDDKVESSPKKSAESKTPKKSDAKTSKTKSTT